MGLAGKKKITALFFLLLMVQRILLIGLLMGTNCALLVADLFLFCHEKLHEVRLTGKSGWHYWSFHFHFQIPAGHLSCICTSCFHYFQKTESPSYNFSVVKNFSKIYPPPPPPPPPQILNFISVCLICGFTSQSTTIVMSRRSVNIR